MKSMTPRQRRMVWVGLLLVGISVAAYLGLTAFQKNLLYFYTPTQVAAGEAPKGYPFRIGGLVEQGSVKRDGQSLLVTFTVSDGNASVSIAYNGILPDLFREGQGIIAMGQLDQAGTFKATEVLAKHDENYMPPEVAESLKQSGKMPTTYKDYQTRRGAEQLKVLEK